MSSYALKKLWCRIFGHKFEIRPGRVAAFFVCERCGGGFVLDSARPHLFRLMLSKEELEKVDGGDLIYVKKPRT